MPNSAPNSEKLTPSHLERAAYIYIRQSSPRQVEQNKGSQQRQYALVDWVCQLGWAREHVIVVDEDQGKSGAQAHERKGFAKLVKAVGQGEVGIVVSLEASRLARNNADWHNLIYMCRYSETLIADEHGIYDPNSPTDRMILGLRGQMSEIEYDVAIHRMVEARWEKASRGEYLVYPPPGYELDDLENIVMTSDEAVASAIRCVFAKFDELGTARRVLAWWKEEGIQFPVRDYSSRSKSILWKEPAYRNILYVLHNPIYAGAYAFGRTETVRELDPDDPRKVRVRQVQRADWRVLLHGHHPEYISYEKFEENQLKIRSNQQMKSSDGGLRGPVREGKGLVQGIVRCGQCGRRMHVSYGGSRPARRGGTLQYRCLSTHQVNGSRSCQLVGGRRVDDAVVEAFIEVTRVAGESAAELAEESLRVEGEDTERAWEMQIEKAQYEADRAERQYNAVDPENRVVARTLEARWEARLRELEDVKRKATQRKQERQPLTELEVARARRLGGEIETIWNADSTTNRDRKQLLRAAIDEVQLQTKEDKYRITIVWKGGATTERELERHRGYNRFSTPVDTVELVRELAKEFDDAQIARVLCKQGRRTGCGNAFTAHKVATLRHRHGIPNCPKSQPRNEREGPFTADEVAAELSVSSSTIMRWIRDGLLPARQSTPGAPWRIVLTEELRSKLTGGEAPPTWVGLTEASRRLGLSKARVAYLVNTGKLKAMRTVVGKRSVWRIDVNSATCGRQDGLF